MSDMTNEPWLEALAARLTFVPLTADTRPPLEAGMLIRSPDGRLWIVGDLNDLGGSCDHCAFTFDWSGHTVAHLRDLPAPDRPREP